MKELVEVIAKSLVDYPDEVNVTETENEKAIVLELRVAQSDMGKVIGKQGRIAKAIRSVVKAAASKEDMMGMMPGMGIGGGKMPDIDTDEAEKGMARTEAIIYSMTPEERRNPKLLNPSRKARIARGAGVDVSEVNRLVKQFEQTKKFMKQMPGMMGGKKGRRGGGGLGGLFKGLPF